MHEIHRWGPNKQHRPELKLALLFHVVLKCVFCWIITTYCMFSSNMLFQRKLCRLAHVLVYHNQDSVDCYGFLMCDYLFCTSRMSRKIRKSGKKEWQHGHLRCTIIRTGEKRNYS